MSTKKTVTCPVDTQGDYGVYANAFRIMQDGSDAVLDFCIYSEQDHAAKTVSRVRISPSFLNVIISRLHEAVSVTTEGDRLYLMPGIVSPWPTPVEGDN